MTHSDEIVDHARRLADAVNWYDAYLALCSIAVDTLPAVALCMANDRNSDARMLAATAAGNEGNLAAAFLAIENQGREKPVLSSLITSCVERLQSGDDDALPVSMRIVRECAFLAQQLSAGTGLAALELACYVCRRRPDRDLFSGGFELAGSIQGDTDQQADRIDRTARLYYLRYQAIGQRPDLDRAIELGSEALALETAGGSGRAWYLAGLANRFQDRYHETGSRADLERATQLADEALDHAASDGAARAPHLSNKASLILERFYVTGAAADLGQAIELGTEALFHAPLAGFDRAVYLCNQANRLDIRYQATGAREDLDRSIELGAEALLHCPASGSGRAGYLSNQGIRSRLLYEAEGERADLQRSLELAVEALAQGPSSGPARATYLFNLASRLRLRYQAIGDRDDLERAIELNAEALFNAPARGPDRATYLSGLALGLGQRDESARGRADLERAIELGAEALLHAPAVGPTRAIYLSNQAIRLDVRYAAIGQLPDLERAIQLGAESLAHIAGGPFRAVYLSVQARRFQKRYEVSGSQGDLEVQASLGIEWAATVAVGRGTRVGVMSYARWWMNRFSHLAALGVVSWETVGAAGRAVLARAARFAILPESGPGRDDIERDAHAISMREAVDGVMGVTALACVRSGNPVQAIEVLEDGAATIARDQASRIPWDVASRTVPDLARHALELQARIIHATATGSTEGMEIVHDDYATAIAELREALSIPTVTPLGVAELSARSSGRLVWVVATPEGGLALGLDPGGAIHHLELADVTTGVNRIWHGRLHPHLPDAEARGGKPPSRRPVRAPVRHGVPAPPEVMAVVVELRAALGPVDLWLEAPGTVLIPIGLLGSLPWQSHYSGLRLHVTATQAVRPPEPARHGPIVVFADAGAGGELPEAREEADVLAYKHHAEHAVGDAATFEGLTELKTCRILHLALHASPDPAIWFADGRMDLENVHRLRHLWPSLELVFLNCCTSAATLEAVRDETLGIATIALTGGAQAALVALWPVQDDAACTFATAFYQHWAGGHSLHEALAWAREHTRVLHRASSTADAYQLLN